MRSAPGQHNTATMCGGHLIANADNLLAALTFRRIFGEVLQPSWDYRPRFPRLASGGSCQTKSFAERLNRECFKGKRDARPEIKTFVQTGITNARTEGTSGGSNRSNVSDADSEIETIQHAGYVPLHPQAAGRDPTSC